MNKNKKSADRTIQPMSSRTPFFHSGLVERAPTALHSPQSDRSGIRKTHLHFSRSPQSFAYFRQQHQEYTIKPGSGISPSSVSFPPISSHHVSMSLSGFVGDVTTQSTQKTRVFGMYDSTSELDVCAARIQRCYRSFRDRRIFIEMKESLRAAENSISTLLLRQLDMNEASLVTDRSTPAVVRLRFWGISFPPKLVYKVFLKQKVYNINASEYFGPSSKGFKESLKSMGQSAFSQVLKTEGDFKKSDIIDKGWRPLSERYYIYNKFNRKESAALPPLKCSNK